MCSLYIYKQEKLILQSIKVRDYRDTIIGMINYRNYTKAYLPEQQKIESATIWKSLVDKVNNAFGQDIKWG